MEVTGISRRVISASGLRALQRALPLVAAGVLLLLGYLHYAPGTAYSLSERHYRAYAFPAFEYSDLIWLYLRDGLETRPIPYVDYPLEYPPLTGMLSYLLSFAPDLPTYFGLAYLTLALCALGTVWILGRLPGVSSWRLAAAPALFFYVGHQWDVSAIFVTALALLAITRGHDRWGAIGLAAAVSLKLFPFAFVAALLVERVRQRRFRAVAEIAGLFALGSLVVNLPFALASRDGWLFFYRWNRDRLADSGIWVLWRDVPTADATRASLVLAVVGGIALTVFALRLRGPLLLPLGATYLLWWLFANKTFTTHLILWVFLALALLRASWWLWGAVVAVDVAGFQLGNFLNLYNISEFQNQPLVQKAVVFLYDPLQVTRSLVLLVAIAWAVRKLATAPLPLRDRGDLVHGTADTGSLAEHSRREHPGWGKRVAPVSQTVAVPPPSTSRSTRWAWGLLVTAAYGLATVLMTWPYATRMTTSTVVGVDPLLQIWLTRSIQHAIATDIRGLFDANIFYPFDLTLAYTDANIPGALIAAPLFLLTSSAVFTNSLLTLGSFVFAGGGMYALVHHLTRNRGAAFLSGLAFAFLPFRMVHLWHLNWLQNGWLPWIVLTLLIVIQRPSWGKAIVLGVLIAVQAMTSVYFVVQIGIVIGAVLITAVISQRDRLSKPVVLHLAASLGLAALLVLPAYLPYATVRSEQGLERYLYEAEHFKARPLSYLKRPPWDEGSLVSGWLTLRGENLAAGIEAPQADGHVHREYVVEDALYPGLFALGAAGIGLLGWSRRRVATTSFVVVALVAFVFSLGPSWSGFGGAPSTTSGTISLPYRFFFEHLTVFKAMRVPSRFGGLVGMAIVVLGGLGVARGWEWLSTRGAQANRPAVLDQRGRRRWLGVVLTLGLSGVILSDLYTGAIPLETIDISPTAAAPYDWLAQEAEPGPVMEFPADPLEASPDAASNRRHTGLAMFWSTRHWNPLINGYSGFIPAAHRNLIDAFRNEPRRGQRRDDGGLSHVDADSLALLQQLQIRYLLFHPSRYAPMDWTTVVDHLDSLEGDVNRVAEFDDAVIYEVREPLNPPRPPELTMFAPSLLGPETRWAPWFFIDKPDSRPALLKLTRVSRLTATWYDADGRKLNNDDRRVPLPTVVTAEGILCSTAACETTRAFDTSDDLPPPDRAAAAWRPEKPGHYMVRLQLTGDQSIDCRVDVDIVADDDLLEDVSPDTAYRWAACVSERPFPVNNPGERAFRSPSPSITFVDEHVAIEATLSARRDEEIRAWFLLAPAGVEEPWRHVVYQSSIQQRLVLADEVTDFAWLETLPPEVPPGVYSLTIWFHRRTDDGWKHAYGGDYQVSPVVLAEDGTLRWAGPLRIRRSRPLPAFQTGRTSSIRFQVSGAADDAACEASWRLRGSIDHQVVRQGYAGDCESPRIYLPAAVDPGRFLLEIMAFETRDGEQRLSDGVTLPITVTDGSGSGVPR